LNLGIDFKGGDLLQVKYEKPVEGKNFAISLIKEMEYLHDIIKGGEITEEYEKLLNGVAALESIATADACTLSVKEDRKVRLSEITNA